MRHFKVATADLAFDEVTISQYLTFMEIMARADIHLFAQKRAQITGQRKKPHPPAAQPHARSHATTTVRQPITERSTASPGSGSHTRLIEESGTLRL